MCFGRTKKQVPRKSKDWLYMMSEVPEICAIRQNDKGDLFTALSNRLQGKTTSRVERLFRTVNMRINVVKWSTKGGLNVTKVRRANYYNGFDA